jgi:hypothetical protein
LPDDGTQGSLGHLVVIRDREAPVGRIHMTQDDVAASLVIGFLSDLAQSLDDIAAGDERDLTQIETSTISSEIGGGVGSEWIFRLSR